MWAGLGGDFVLCGVGWNSLIGFGGFKMFDLYVWCFRCFFFFNREVGFLYIVV